MTEQTHLDIHDNPQQTRMKGLHTKAYLVAMFAEGWGIDHAVEHYAWMDITRDGIEQAIQYYHENHDAIHAELDRIEKTYGKGNVS